MMKRFAVLALLLSIGLSPPVLAQSRYLWVEAESGAEYNPIVVKSDWAASQRIYLASWRSSNPDYRTLENGLITFDVYIPEAGDYTLWGRMRLPFSGSKPYDVSFGSSDVHDNSQWTRWKADNRSYDELSKWGWSHSGVTQYLAAGMHTIHLVQREGGSGLHLDKILLTNDSYYQPTGVGGAEAEPMVDNPYKANVVGKYGQLRVANGKLSDKNNYPVQLQGISAHGLQWFPIVDNQTIPYAAEFFGAEVVRLAMYIEDYAPTDPSDFWGGYVADKAAMLARTEAAIEDAVAAGIYVMVDWHIHNVPSRYTTEAVDFFTYISKKYGHLPNIIYEICNEPVSVTWSSGIKPYAETVIRAIRANDPDNVIIVGTPNWSQDVDAAARDPLAFSNIMYAFHFYAASHDFNTMRSKVETALNAGLAVFVSEWGSSDVGTSRSNYTVAKQWMDFMNQHKLSWINWSLGNKDESSSILAPRTPLSGPWTSADLTTAGSWIKPYFDAPVVDTITADSGSATDAGSGESAPTTSTVIEAEKHSFAQNVTLIDGNTAVGYFDAYDHFGFRGIALDGVTQLVLRHATANSGGVAEIRIGSVSGPLLATVNVSSTGGWSSYQDKTVSLTAPVTGSHDLFIIGKSGGGIFNLDRLTLVKSTSGGTTTAPAAVEAEKYSDSRGITLVDGNSAVGYFDSGDYVGYRGVNVDGMNQLVLRMSAATSGGVIEVRADGVYGPILASIHVSATGGYSSYQEKTFTLSSILSGTRDLYFVGKTGSGILNIDRFSMAKGSDSGSSSPGVAFHLEAEKYSRIASGAVSILDSNQRVGYFDQGDHLVYSGVKMDGVKQLVLRLAKGNSGGTLELRAGHAYGTLLASFNPASTGSYNQYVEVTLPLNATLTGLQDLYLVGTNGQGIANIDRLTLSDGTTSAP